jgi:hypothetical protein
LAATVRTALPLAERRDLKAGYGAALSDARDGEHDGLLLACRPHRRNTIAVASSVSAGTSVCRGHVRVADGCGRRAGGQGHPAPVRSGLSEMNYVMSAEFGGWYQYQIRLDRSDGAEVVIYVANGPDITQPTPDRAAPPGTLAEWEAIAESPLWHQ